MPGTGQDRHRFRIAASLTAGALALAVGLVLARAAGLPEWRPGPFPGQGALGRHFVSVATRCGLRLVGEGPRFEVVESSARRRLRNELPLTSAVPRAGVAILAMP